MRSGIEHHTLLFWLGSLLDLVAKAQTKEWTQAQAAEFGRRLLEEKNKLKVLNMMVCMHVAV